MYIIRIDMESNIKNVLKIRSKGLFTRDKQTSTEAHVPEYKFMGFAMSCYALLSYYAMLYPIPF